MGWNKARWLGSVPHIKACFQNNFYARTESWEGTLKILPGTTTPVSLSSSASKQAVKPASSYCTIFRCTTLEADPYTYTRDEKEGFNLKLLKLFLKISEKKITENALLRNRFKETIRHYREAFRKKRDSGSWNTSFRCFLFEFSGHYGARNTIRFLPVDHVLIITKRFIMTMLSIFYSNCFTTDIFPQ